MKGTYMPKCDVKLHPVPRHLVSEDQYGAARFVFLAQWMDVAFLYTCRIVPFSITFSAEDFFFFRKGGSLLGNAA
jgi:hypothetical protein